MNFFTLNELTRSQTATTRGINNMPNTEQQENLRCLVTNLLDPIRERWGRPLTVISGFRSEALNRAVGGSATSDHRTGRAVDISAGNATENRRLFEMIRTSGLQFDQMYPITGKSGAFSSIHVSFRKTGNRNQILNL